MARISKAKLKAYQKSRGIKGVLEIGSAPSGENKEKENLNEVFQDMFKSFAQAESSILRLNRGLKYTPLTLPSQNEGRVGNLQRLKAAQGQGTYLC